MSALYASGVPHSVFLHAAELLWPHLVAMPGRDGGDTPVGYAAR